MFASFNSSFGMTGGSAIFGALLPTTVRRPFISSFSFPDQDSIQQDRSTVFSAFANATQANLSAFIPFIGAF